MSHFLDDSNRTNDFIVDAGTELAKYWPGARNDGQTRDVRVARSLAAVDTRIASLALATAACIEAGELEAAEEIAKQGLETHGASGRGAVFAVNRALVARARGDWTAARDCYVRAIKSRVERYRCAAIAAGSLAALDFDDSETAVLLCDRGLVERPALLQSTFATVRTRRTQRGIHPPSGGPTARLADLLRSTGRSAQRILGAIQ